jgi:excisionase family DNA binding protein
MSNEWLSLGEIAKKLGVHPSTVRNWANQGKIPFHRTQGGHRRFKSSEVDFWLHPNQTRSPNEVGEFLQDAIKRMRVQISESHLEAESWYQKLDHEARMKYRQSGRNLVQGLITYLTTDGDEADAEARSLGYEYATRGRRYQLQISEATKAFLFFHNSLLDALLAIYESAVVRSPLVLSGMVRKINAFTDRILLTIMETYEAFDRSKRG